MRLVKTDYDAAENRGGRSKNHEAYAIEEHFLTADIRAARTHNGSSSTGSGVNSLIPRSRVDCETSDAHPNKPALDRQAILAQLEGRRWCFAALAGHSPQLSRSVAVWFVDPPKLPSDACQGKGGCQSVRSWLVRLLRVSKETQEGPRTSLNLVRCHTGFVHLRLIYGLSRMAETITSGS